MNSHSSVVHQIRIMVGLRRGFVMRFNLRWRDRYVFMVCCKDGQVDEVLSYLHFGDEEE